MRIFKSFGEDISYKDVLQLDSSFAVAHVNYGRSPMFNNTDGKDITQKSRKHSMSSEENIKDVLECLYSFSGIEKDINKDDKMQIWEEYWLEYINAFDKLIELLPNSVVTIFIGRQAIELGIKYLLLRNSNKVHMTHDLKHLMELLLSEFEINDSYMDYVVSFCERYCKYIEGGNPEYFRFPEYKGNNYFAGNRLDINWLSYNFSLILLKLLHFANLEDRF